MGFITGWGEGPMFVLVIIAYALQKAWWRAGEFVAAGILSSVLVQCLKKLVFAPSPRPMGHTHTCTHTHTPVFLGNA